MTNEVLNIKTILQDFLQQLEDPKFIEWLYESNSIEIINDHTVLDLNIILSEYKANDGT